MLVALPDGKGVGKLENVENGICTVSVFRSIVRTETIELPIDALERAYLSPQTRVYVRDDDGMRVGRVADYLAHDTGLVEYEVRFPNGKRGDISELKLYLRPWSAPEDPAEVMANGGAESQFLHDRRQAAMLPLLALRSAAQGMTALVSAGIEMAPHQVAAVRRVLTDPVQRYLLADEVGLGKTIEAGLIARQHLIDDPNTSVLIAVPLHLCGQWQDELTAKLRLDQFDGAFEVVAHADLARVRRAPDILIIDEAHHLVGMEDGPLAAAAKQLVTLAAEASVLLLLSATPALGDERRFLALLNLLDPAAHPLDDVEGFRSKLENRREIGRLLLALDPLSPGLVLRRRGAELESLFPDDPVVAELAPRLISATREAPDEVDALCASLRSHVADSYRIHQRLIRSRRADAQGWEFMARGPSQGEELGFSHVRVEADTLEPAGRVFALAEEWRFAAVEAANGAADALSKLARRYGQMLSSLAAGREATFAWIDSVCAEPYFPEETGILEPMRGAVADELTDDGLDTARESALRLIRSLRQEGTSHPKIVAFASTAAVAEHFVSALEASAYDGSVLALLPGRGSDGVIANFSKAHTSAILVCDEHGEEGLNLACADAIVHLDLPFSAARIEQRIGRLDRFGRRHGVVRHRIVLPCDEDDSPWTGWFDFVAEGLMIFHRSISDVQLLMESFELQCLQVLLERGPQAIGMLAEQTRAAIAEERRSQDEQYALDRIALAEEPAETLLEALDAAEEDEAALEAGVDHWLVGALQLKKRPFQWPDEDPFKLAVGRDTLIPRLPWLSRFDLDGGQAFTWRRRIATAHSEVTLLRPGTPLIDMAERFTRWDDRGTAFVTWRTAPEWSDEPWLGFRLCFVIEPDIPLSDLLAPSRTELASIRRAQRFLPARAHTLHVDGDGDPVIDPALLKILERPYDGARGEGSARDLNLASRPQIFARVVDPSQFAQMCRTARDAARLGLLADSDLREAIATGTRLAAADLERRRQRLQSRQSAADTTVRADLAALAAILPAIERPAIRLDAIGCFIVSREGPSGARRG